MKTTPFLLFWSSALAVALAIASGAASTAAAQSRTVTLDAADIPRLPVDTLPTDRAEVRLVTFTDNTFRFIPADR
jgi:hypothetical protein